MEFLGPIQRLFRSSPAPRRAFYDFAVSPFSYDFVPFLMCARDHGCDEVVFVPGQREFQKCSPEEQAQRMANILLPLADRPTVCTDREEAAALWHQDCFPIGYTVERPLAGHSLGQSLAVGAIHPLVPLPDRLARARELGVDSRTVTITIRETAINAVRNSNIAAWIDVARWLSAQGLEPVFIPDTENPGREFAGFRTIPAAAVDVQLRLAIYDRALLNAGVNNGPLALCIYSARPVLVFRMIADTYPTSAEFFRNNGLPPGQQPWWFTPRQRLVWESNDDAAGVIEHIARWLAAAQVKQPA